MFKIPIFLKNSSQVSKVFQRSKSTSSRIILIRTYNHLVIEMFQWKIRMEKRVDSARALSSLPTARWQSVREVSLPLSIPPSSFVCHASATFPAAYFFPIGCAERATSTEGGGEECAGLTEERRTIESTGGQPRWLGRIRVPTC